jgi:hypothetical protein
MAKRKKKSTPRSGRAKSRKRTAHPAPAAAVAVEQAPADFGRFEGPVQAEWLPDGRNMFLLAPLVFLQTRDNTVWTAPVRTRTDGATIPQPFWSVIGGPFEGKYRDAAVNHDYECCVKVHPWRKVHRMFYDGMRANDTAPWLAKLMYFAVYFFGPRWPVAEAGRRQRFSEGDIARVARWLQSDPTISLEDIEALTQRSLRERVPGKPQTIEGARALSDDTPLKPVEREEPCTQPLP